jgi:hypothetical protein
MTVTADLDRLRALLRRVDPAALTPADVRAMLAVVGAAATAAGIK